MNKLFDIIVSLLASVGFCAVFFVLLYGHLEMPKSHVIYVGPFYSTNESNDNAE